MSKLPKWLSGTVGATLAGAMLFGVAGTFGASDALAQSPPAPPARFAGNVTIDGEPASAGTAIEARVDGNTCGVTTVESGSTYVVDVEAAAPANNNGCGAEGSTVTFVVGGQAANESGPWVNFDLNVLDLSVTSATETPETPTPDTETPTPVTQTPDDGDDDNGDDDDGDDDNGTGTTATPRPPTTGTGVSSESGQSAAWLFTLLGLGAAGVGAAGAVAARRK